MKAFVKVLIALFFIILIYLVFGYTMDLVTGNILPYANETNVNYTTLSNLYNVYDIVFAIVIVISAIAAVVAYLLERDEGGAYNERDFRRY